MSVNEKMTAIADAIRDKTGETEALTLDDMATAISEVYDAGKQAEYDRFWDTHQINGTRNIYAGAFAGWRGVNFKPKYKIAPKGSTVAWYMFYAFNRTEQTMFDMSPYNDMLDFSGVTNASNMFADARVKNLYCDLSKCTDINHIFHNINSVASNYITLKLSAVLTTTTNAFRNMNSLTEIRFTEDSEIKASISFSWQNNLSDESVQSIINALGVVTSTKTITFHSTVANKLTTEQVAQIADKGWTLG